MTLDRELASALRGLLADDTSTLPDRVLDAVLADVPRTRQQRAWWPGRTRRWSPIQLASAVAALVVIVVVGVVLFPRPNGRVGGPGPSQPAVLPSATASSPASAAASGPPTSAPPPTPSPGYGSAPPGWPTNAPYVPATPLPKPAGSPLRADLIGRQYNVDPPSNRGNQAQVLTLRAADDPMCLALYGGKSTSTCYTILWTPNYPQHVQDPAVRGPARIVDGKLALGISVIPNEPGCDGTAVYAISPDGWTLTGLQVPPCAGYLAFTRH